MRIANHKASYIAIILLLTFLMSAQAQTQDNKPRVVDWAGGYFGIFNPLRVSSKGFEDVESIFVNYLPRQEDDERLLLPNTNGLIPTAGELISKGKAHYEFEESNLIEGGRLIKIRFVTKQIKGISYSFSGRYLDDNIEVRRGGKILGYIHLTGTLTKFKDGRRIAQTKIGLYQFGIE